jgi:uncharacterized protein YndB with AHSA1/START domain
MTMPTRPDAESMADDELLIVRSFVAPAALLFQMWSDPSHMKRWLGPAAFTCIAADLDFRVGGAWRACIQSAERGARWMGGRYREIAPGRRIVMTFAWEDGRDPPGVETLVTIDFVERDGTTTQRFHQAPFKTIEDRDGHIEGWTQTFDKEKAHAEGLGA